MHNFHMTFSANYLYSSSPSSAHHFLPDTCSLSCKNTHKRHVTQYQKMLPSTFNKYLLLYQIMLGNVPFTNLKKCTGTATKVIIVTNYMYIS